MIKNIISTLKNRKNAIAMAEEKLQMAELLNSFYTDDGCECPFAEDAIQEAKRELEFLKMYTPLQIVLHMLKPSFCRSE